MDNQYHLILTEIEEIISKIGNFDSGQSKISKQGRRELTQLFRKKLKMAQSLNDSINESKKFKLVS